MPGVHSSRILLPVGTMRTRPRFRSLGHLLVPVLLIVCVLSGGLGWLAWQVLKQDRALENQRILDRLGTGADLAGTALLRRLVEVEELLARIDTAPETQWGAVASQIADASAGDAVVVVFRQERVDAFPRAGLLYYPVVPGSTEAPRDRFAEGETLEFRQRSYPAAITFFRKAAREADPATRAGALVRLARTLRKANRHLEALVAYDELAAIAAASPGDPPVRLAGVPVDLMARQARCALFDELEGGQQARSEAALLLADLQRRRWQLTESVYRFYADDALQRSRTPSPPDAIEPDALTASVQSLWTEWRDTAGPVDRLSGRRSAWAREQPVLLVSRAGPDRLVAFAATPAFLERQWLAGLRPALERLNVQVALADANNRPVYRTAAERPPFRVVRSPAETELPWTLHVSSANPDAELAQISARRRFVLAGLVLLIALLAGAGYVTARAVARELYVARLQSDFVSAVSHEFRTPLASLRQLSELLADGRVATEERRQQYYEGLRHESERLHRLVENLLDFGRMEAGAREYHFETIDAAALARSVADEFGQEVAERGYRVEIAGDGRPAPVHADREALARAVWNLLDNAVKYSPKVKTVWIDARADGNDARIEVRDQGAGIAREEQHRIFDKFVRGASAAAGGIKGTGLGLAMVRHIVRAHGGTVGVASEPGRGSTFTIALPALGERDSETCRAAL